MRNEKTYQMKVDLNVLNHLGIRLYSSIPAVVSEAVANSWDADATLVKIRILEDEIHISDNGHGMNSSELNDKFLTVGYQRRRHGGAFTPSGRKVLGRKGIGKLSLFSIANVIEVQSFSHGERCGLVLNLADIQKSINDGESVYRPRPLREGEISVEEGTTIIIRGLRRGTTRSSAALRRRIARRFSAIGNVSGEKGFDVEINDVSVTIEDREYYKKLEFIWSYGEMGESIQKISSAVQVFPREAAFEGWIGTVRSAGDLVSEDGDNLNDIQIMVRGRVAQEKTLQFFGEDGLYAAYLVGEIHADWLDDDDKEDIATTNRQTLIEDDPRVVSLRDELRTELKHIQNKWTNLRNDLGAKEALKIKEVESWFNTLGSDQKSKARQLFGKINILKLDPEQKKPLFRYAVLAFEKLRIKDNLSRIDELKDGDISGFLNAFRDYDEIEAFLYYEISKGRLDIITHFENMAEDDQIERLLQQFLFEHLWLLDPSWDRAATDPVMEVEVKKAVLNGEEFDAEYMEEIGRVDIQYRKSGGEHVIVELKRAGRTMDTRELFQQCSKYQRKMDQLLFGSGRSDESYSIICLVGKDLSDWKNPRGRELSQKQLESCQTRVMTYKELIGNARRAYSEYLQVSKKATQISEILEAIEAGI